ncbi:hypothetical protein Btru_073833 [Bulinus truncatus]|nr:hypothetical protein Btru_073833 [Bulinus truncatus]
MSTSKGLRSVSIDWLIVQALVQFQLMEELYMKLADERAKITSKVIVSENTYEIVTVAMAIDDLKKRNDDLNKFVDFANSQR